VTLAQRATVAGRRPPAARGATPAVRPSAFDPARRRFRESADGNFDGGDAMDARLFVIGALVAGVAIWAALAYNRLVALRAGVRNGFAQIEVQLRRRFDLVPNLVEVARKYMEHERATLEAVTVARNLASHATQRASQAPGDLGAMQRLSQTAGMLSDSIGRLMVVAEAYPELKADARMGALSEELSSTENRIAFARQAYNDAVMDYNVAIGVFPVNLVATLFGFAPSRQLNAAEIPAQREAVRVQF